MPEDYRYKMSLSLNVLNHLGINLYSNIPSVLSEIVANSWDADAEEVYITIEDGQITIEDTGTGMSANDINEKFLLVGYKKREQRKKSLIHNRDYMGRKGIGKLSMFSIAKEIIVCSTYCNENGEHEHNAFLMQVSDIEKSIVGDNQNNVYHPKELIEDEYVLDHVGTKIILRDLKKNISSLTPKYIRTRVARRFGIIGDTNKFKVYINGDEVTVEDRDYYDKINYIWYYGENSKIYSDYATKKAYYEQRDSKIICGGKTYNISGWIGTVEVSGSLKEGEDNLNKIVILVRGKVGQEDILSEFSEGGLYSKYLIGEIHADFFDDDSYDDMATSSRQEYRKDDERFIALREFIRSELKYIQGNWTELRHTYGTEKAIEVLPAIEDWYKTLQGDDRKYAKKMFGKVNQIIIEDGKRTEILKYSVLAFEKLRYINKLSEIDNLNPENLELVGSVFSGLDEIEATLYYQIVKERTEVIKHFVGLTEDNAKERVIQEYLFDHLWLLDPSWERTEGSEYMESTILKALDVDFQGLTDEQKRGRLDIGYRKSAGKHIIIELKRADRIVKKGEVIDQIGKYSDTIEAVLDNIEHQRSAYEIVFVVGKPIDNDSDINHREKIEKSLVPYNARIVYYNELIENAYRAYSEYLNANKKTQPLIEMFEKFENDMD